MIRHFSRKDILGLLENKVKSKCAVITCQAGLGIVAKAANEMKIDIVFSDALGYQRMHGNCEFVAAANCEGANDILEIQEKKIALLLRDIPVVAGISALSPNSDIWLTISHAVKKGFDGIVNLPSITMLGAEYREQMERAGCGFNREVDMVARCHKEDLFTAAYVTCGEDAKKMASAGADLIIASTPVGFEYKKEEMAERLRAITADAVGGGCGFVLIQCEPYTKPEEVQWLLKQSGAHGFFGCSCFDREPMERALSEEIAAILSVCAPKQ